MATVIDLARPDSIIDIPHNRRNSISSRDSFTITPSDIVNFTKVPREIQCGSSGTVAVVKFDDVVQSYTVVAGERITEMCKRVNSTGTTASPLVAVL